MSQPGDAATAAADLSMSAGEFRLLFGCARRGWTSRWTAWNCAYTVLLDLPRLRGCDWLERGDHLTVADLLGAAKSQDVRICDGDILFVRVGHRRRRTVLGRWDAASTRAGHHPSAVELLADRRIAVLGSDSNNDTAPSAAEGVEFPVHVLALRAVGMMLLDYLQFEDLVPACAATGRWSFLCVIAPLRLPTGTGSPVNPIAIF